MTGLPLFLIDQGMAGYDESRGFVVAAESEDQARALLSAPLDADADADFGRGLYAGDEGPQIWADPSMSRCQQISEGSIYENPTVVIRDFHAG